jgi:hypothetical protein
MRARANYVLSAFLDLRPAKPTHRDISFIPSIRKGDHPSLFEPPRRRLCKAISWTRQMALVRYLSLVVAVSKA